ncbi:hypothetical protein E2C01_003774 [Portunus trituberculatus]|uniref:Uncharacterized protein n=1 Tax=Portunus trituberculatus TaxID=210409 RepID=A0A5B7CNV0_PORTR|nr:hypothetical protein [Portunus trituberculatus]
MSDKLAPTLNNTQVSSAAHTKVLGRQAGVVWGVGECRRKQQQHHTPVSTTTIVVRRGGSKRGAEGVRASLAAPLNTGSITADVTGGEVNTSPLPRESYRSSPESRQQHTASLHGTVLTRRQKELVPITLPALFLSFLLILGGDIYQYASNKAHPSLSRRSLS